ncbi:MAG: tRNA guanosine(34) transglycosylase Tgt [Armatimonadetes bacterium]|nr:tRNA guanosine(34) transglycosylase Tgt [Armatimonadota bacterium]
MTRTLDLAHGSLQLPAFLPDATLGVVRAVDSADLEACGVQALVMNAFHLMQRPGAAVVTALGGAHRFAGWQRPIVADSGGFQAWSMLRDNPKLGSVNDDGMVIRLPDSDRKLLLTPEKCVQVQVRLGVDVVMCLDECTHVDDAAEVQERSVRRTIAWARRCRSEFDKLCRQKKLDDTQRPRLFAVIQGGASLHLRGRCAEALLELGFDGYGYGGWPLDADGNLVAEVLAFVRQSIPGHLPLHALGVGHPLNVADAAALGYDLFDCALPTRDARRGRVYQFLDAPAAGRTDWLRMHFLTDEKHVRSDQPIDPTCDCLTCTRYARGYLHHLYRANEATFQRLATLHNVRCLTRLTEALRPADGLGGPA